MSEEILMLKLSAEKAIVGYGPFRESPTQPLESAFYLQDFLMTRPAPWLIPARIEELHVDTPLPSSQELSEPVCLQPDLSAYKASFDFLMAEINAGRLQKAVPVIFFKLLSAVPSRDNAVSRILNAPEILHGYFVSMGSDYCFGASPEILLSRNFPDGELLSEAVAGTLPAERRVELLESSKLSHEQELVIGELTRALNKLGNVGISYRETSSIGGLSHIISTLTLKPKVLYTLEEIIRAIHPTGAVGAIPRVRTAEIGNWLDPSGIRALYGAPFGVALADGRAKFTVMIRGIVGRNGDRFIGAGGGLVAGSSFEEEWSELMAKKESVCRLLLR